MGLRREARSTAGIALLLLFGVSYAITALFPTDILAPGERPHTVVGAIHAVAALGGFLCAALGAILVSRRLKADIRFAAVRPMLLAMAWLVLLALFGLVAVMGARLAIPGLAEKLFIGLREAWLLALALNLRRLA